MSEDKIAEALHTLKDYVMFNTGECDDRLRNRDLYLVRKAGSPEEARSLLQAYFDRNEYSDLAEDYSVMFEGTDIQDGAEESGHSCYRFNVVQ